MKQSYPLNWPVGYKRVRQRIDSRFKQSFSAAQYALKDEVRKLGGTDVVVSTNLRTRGDGNIYYNDLDKLIDDPAVAVYFKYKGKEVSMCCDQYRRVWENMYALSKGIQALRGMERWGVSEFLDRAFTGFTALPAAEQHRYNWWDILGVPENCTEQQVKDAYRNKAKIAHPDVPGGSDDAFKKVYAAYHEGIFKRAGK